MTYAIQEVAKLIANQLKDRLHFKKEDYKSHGTPDWFVWEEKIEGTKLTVRIRDDDLWAMVDGLPSTTISFYLKAGSWHNDIDKTVEITKKMTGFEEEEKAPDNKTEDLLVDFEKKLDKKDQALKNKSWIIVLRENELDDLTTEVYKRQREIESDLESEERDLDSRDQEQNNREKDLDKREEELNERESNLKTN